MQIGSWKLFLPGDQPQQCDFHCQNDENQGPGPEQVNRQRIRTSLFSRFKDHHRPFANLLLHLRVIHAADDFRDHQSWHRAFGKVVQCPLPFLFGLRCSRNDMMGALIGLQGDMGGCFEIALPIRFAFESAVSEDQITFAIVFDRHAADFAGFPSRG